MAYARTYTARRVSTTRRPRYSRSRYSTRSSTAARKYLSGASTRRSLTFAKARRTIKSAAHAQVRRNARAIKKLNFSQWGRIQSQTSQTEGATLVLRDHPVCFHLNNPHINTKGPRMWRLDAWGQPVHGDKFVPDALLTKDMQSEDTLSFPNAPYLKLRYASLQFKFSGFVDDCRIRVDVIRRKKLDADFYNQLKTHNFLPHTLTGFKGLAGFSQHQIDRRVFEVLATRHLYMNSRGQSNAMDVAEGEVTTEATTPPTRYCKINLRLNKFMKQLQNVEHQWDADENAEDNALSDRGHPENAQWGFGNQHPLSNIWVVISTDDVTAINDAVVGDNVSVEVIRKLTWQDKD